MWPLEGTPINAGRQHCGPRVGAFLDVTYILRCIHAGLDLETFETLTWHRKDGTEKCAYQIPIPNPNPNPRHPNNILKIQ